MGFGGSRTASRQDQGVRRSERLSRIAFNCAVGGKKWAAGNTNNSFTHFSLNMSFLANLCQTALVVCFVLLTISTNETLACLGGSGGGCCMTSGCPNPCAGYGKK
ncbi:unnamed protein product [Caenorhabditis sp. 36 PRJEB53466]|nr:unnamed protein product [Caenorhabditis sp. 36 PRJEB53466]